MRGMRNRSGIFLFCIIEGSGNETSAGPRVSDILRLNFPKGLNVERHRGRIYYTIVRVQRRFHATQCANHHLLMLRSTFHQSLSQNNCIAERSIESKTSQKQQYNSYNQNSTSNPIPEHPMNQPPTLPKLHQASPFPLAP